jgi:hypothetical protein
MEGQRFDDMARAFADGISRRVALRRAGAAVMGAALALAGRTRDGAAACRGARIASAGRTRTAAPASAVRRTRRDGEPALATPARHSATTSAARSGPAPSMAASPKRASRGRRRPRSCGEPSLSPTRWRRHSRSSDSFPRPVPGSNSGPRRQARPHRWSIAKSSRSSTRRAWSLPGRRNQCRRRQPPS